MAVRSVKLKIHIKLSDGKRTYADPVYEVKGRLKPLFAWVNNKQEHHPEGRYVLRYGDKWQFVGQQVDEVYATKERLEEELAEVAANPTLANPVAVINTAGPTILALLETWLGKLSTIDLETGKAPRATKTVDERRRIVSAFVRITEKMLTVAKGQLFTLYAGLGGIIIDNPDGTTSLHPLASFKSITIEASHIVRVQ